MTYYLVIPANKEAALRTAYAAQAVRSERGDTEGIGAMVIEGSGNRKITGTSRATAQDVSELGIANAPWLQIVTEWPADWVYQP